MCIAVDVINNSMASDSLVWMTSVIACTYKACSTSHPLSLQPIKKTIQLYMYLYRLYIHTLYHTQYTHVQTR